jgi:hypothetical protein
MRDEDQIQKAICQFLDKALPSDSYYFAVPNGSVLAGNPKQRGMQMNKLKATGLKLGCPDLFIIIRGIIFAVEVKTDTGKLSDNQRTACDQIVAAGALWAVARSVEDVERILTDAGITLHAKAALSALR